MECCLIMRSIRGNPVFSCDTGSLLSVLTQCKLACKKFLSCLEYLISTNYSKTVSALPEWNPMLLLYFQILVYDHMWLFYFHNYISYKISEFCGVFSVFLERVLWICFPCVCVRGINSGFICVCESIWSYFLSIYYWHMSKYLTCGFIWPYSPN